ncbi:MAG: selenocysteine-specific translation elongation factor [Proteobacteria bacterium]|nr:selenocysteine-specific translation elongation factor [Pseudomonadota bacterium]
MIVATAGHVDHGKTSLIKQLTGVDTDRLAEEKRRGLTIDLGFAYRRINDEVTLGFIDVPGHSRFINTMIAGVSGIDLGLLVIAADDGPMPQTLEHLEVMRLLGISEFVLVVSKIDRVEAGRVEEVSRAVRAMVPECRHAVFPISNKSGQGVAELKGWLDERALAFKASSVVGNFRLAVDRSFSLKGVGMVVTGTVSAGLVIPGDELEVLPQGTKVRVRSLRVQNHKASRGQAGDRCALNIVGAENVSRGSTLAGIDSTPCSRHLDARFFLMPGAPFSLKHLSPVKLYIGTQRLACKLYFIEAVEEGRLAPGGKALVQLILDEPAVCCSGDRFIIRDDSESVTLGGGIILDPFAPKTGKSRQQRLNYLAAMEQPSFEKTLGLLLQAGSAPLNISQLRKAWNLRQEEWQTLFDKVSAAQFEVESTQYALSEEDWCAAEEVVLSQVRHWHEENPQKQGVGVLDLQTLFLGMNSSPGRKNLFKAVISKLIRGGRLSLVGGLIKATSYKPVLSASEKGHWIKIKEVLLKRGMSIPSLRELALSAGLELEEARTAAQAAARLKQLHKLNDNRYSLSKNLLEHAKIIVELGESQDGITVISYKSRIGSGRKLAIDILEYFDVLRFTQRRGDSRVVIDEARPRQVFGK